MAELLIHVKTGAIITRREDGAEWGCLESRAAYDAMRRKRRLPRIKTCPTFRTQRTALSAAVRDEHRLPVFLRSDKAEREIDTPPPDRFGIVSVPDDVEAEGRRLRLSPDLAARILAGTVPMTAEEFAALLEPVDGD